MRLSIGLLVIMVALGSMLPYLDSLDACPFPEAPVALESHAGHASHGAAYCVNDDHYAGEMAGTCSACGALIMQDNLLADVTAIEMFSPASDRVAAINRPALLDRPPVA